MKTASRSLVLLLAVCAASWLAGGSTLRALHPGGALTEPAYRELRRLSRLLDERARHANEQAQREESWIARRDRSLLRSIADFAERASRFDERMANYRAAPWQVDDELRTLLRNAQDVQDRVRHSRFMDDNALSDWNEAVEILNRMTKVSQSRDGLIDSAPANPGRDEYGDRRNPPGPRDSRELAGLLRELEERAGRAYGLAQRVAAQGPYRREFFQSIRDFHDQAVALRRRVESGASDRAQTRAEAARLLESARQTDQRMRRTNAFPQVWQEWQGAIQVLQRIVNVGG
jgi:hypothetical protein